MLDYGLVLTAAAIACGFAAYTIYIRNILSGKTKPHAFSWFVWGILAGIAFAAQVSAKGGYGAGVMGFTALSLTFIAGLAFIKGKRDFPLFDWVCLAAAFVALGLWLYTKTPVLSVILITATDAFAFLPTIRKGYQKPYEETATTFALNGTKFFLSLFALNRFTIATAFYPGALVAMNVFFVTMLLVRRRIVKA